MAIIACAIFQALIRTWSRILIFNVGRNIEYGLRRDVFEHLCRMDAGFYRRHPTGDVMSRLTNDLGSVRMLFGPGLLNVFNTQPPLSVDKVLFATDANDTPNPTFGKPTSYAPPRRFFVSGTFSF